MSKSSDFNQSRTESGLNRLKELIFRNPIQTFTGMVIALVAITHLYHATIYSINIPYSDDYAEVLGSSATTINAPSFSAKLSSLTSAIGPSRVVFTRLLALFSQKLTGAVDLKLMVIMGNIFFILLLLPLALFFKGWRSIYLLPLPFLLYHTQSWEALYQATLATSVYPALFFAFSAIIVARRSDLFGTAAAIGLAVMATISFGNGLLSFPILMLGYGYQRRWKELAVSAAVMLLLFFTLHSGGSGGSPLEWIQNSGNLIGRLSWFLVLIGSSLGYTTISSYAYDPTFQTISLLVGILVCAIYLYLIYCKFYREHTTLFALFTFMMLTATVVTLVRGGNFSDSIAARYLVQSNLMIAIAYLCLIQLAPRKLQSHIIVYFTMCAALFWGMATKYTEDQSAAYMNRRIGNLIHLKNGRVDQSYFGDQQVALNIYKKVTSQGIYRPPTNEELLRAAIVTRADGYLGLEARISVLRSDRRFREVAAEYSKMLEVMPQIIKKNVLYNRMMAYRLANEICLSYADLRLLQSWRVKMSETFQKNLNEQAHQAGCQGARQD